MIKVAIYARYSSELQRESSIEDQVRTCQLRANREGWIVTKTYHDRAISGASMMRAGLQNMMQDAAARQFDMIITEGLDRLSRDQENIAGIYKRLSFAGVKIFSLSDGGEISDIHIGLKGTMNALFLKDLAVKTRRGVRGRIEQGKAGGGRVYGYDIVRRFNEAGEVVKGEREINAAQAIIIKRIFEEYAAGKSPRAIAIDLNAENVASPKGQTWSPITISGNRNIGTGVLNNALYIGQLVWNKRTYSKNPDTGERCARLNPKEEWVYGDVPELRIIEQSLWDKVKAKQAALSLHERPEQKRRAKTLLSGLVQCGCCGGNYNKMSKQRFYCVGAKRKGSCTNRLSVRIDALENLVLSALQNHLMNASLFETFCAEYSAQLAQLSHNQNTHIKEAEAKLVKLKKEKENMIEAIKAGMPAGEFKEAMQSNAQEREYTEHYLQSTSVMSLDLPADLAVRYKEAITHLQYNFQDEAKHCEVADLLRRLIDKIVLTPNEDQSALQVDLYGDIAGILNAASDNLDLSLITEFIKTNPDHKKNQNTKQQITHDARKSFLYPMKWSSARTTG